MIGKSLYSTLFSGLVPHGHHHASEYRQEKHRQEHVIPEHLHKIKYKTKKSTWHIPHPFKAIKEYTSWGEIKFMDLEGNEMETHIESFESQEKNPFLKHWEVKLQKYLAYEAAAKMFYPTDQYESKGKCPIMSLLTSESQIDAKMEEPQDTESPFYVEEPETKGVPTAMFHGFGDFCMQPGDIQFNYMLAHGTGASVKCIEVGVPAVGSIINNF